LCISPKLFWAGDGWNFPPISPAPRLTIALLRGAKARLTWRYPMSTAQIHLPEEERANIGDRLRSLQQKLPLSFPLGLNIESTNFCNLDCFFCPRKEAVKGEGLMDFELFTRIVDECAEHGPIGKVSLHKDGEPLAHPRIVDMVRYLKDKSAAETISFTSNGILMKQRKAEQLLEAGLNQVSFSIDATSGDTYKQSKGRDKYDQVEENVRNFLAMKPDDVQVAVKFIRMQENEGEEECFIETWRNLGADILITEYHDWSGSVRDSSLVSIEATSSYACENPWYSLAVNWDGKVSICCVDWDSQAVVGDANSESIYDIWHGEALRSIRETHLAGRAHSMSPCDTCTYKSAESREIIGGWLMGESDRLLGIQGEAAG
jgi:MoaA/NifB/PqqE/SkfB family radical SAM enzyme